MGSGIAARPPTEAPKDEVVVRFVGQAPGVVVRQTSDATCCVLCCWRRLLSLAAFQRNPCWSISPRPPFFLVSPFICFLYVGSRAEPTSVIDSSVWKGKAGADPRSHLDLCRSLTPFFFPCGSAGTCPLPPADSQDGGRGRLTWATPSRDLTTSTEPQPLTRIKVATKKHKNEKNKTVPPPLFPHFRSLFSLLLLPPSILETASRDILPYKK